MIILETDKLILREIVEQDAQAAYELNLDPEVIQYTGDVAFESVEAAKDFLKGYDHYKKYGFGRWGVILKSTNEFLGWCGLKYTPELNEYDIGFRFFKKHWAKGYATESAKACLLHGFDQLGMTTIVGRAMPENKASVRVLHKIGMEFWEERVTDGERELVFRKINRVSSSSAYQ